MYKALIDDYFQQHKEEYLNDLAKLIAIDSRQGDEKPGMPFGEGPAAALNLALEIAAGYGLYTENEDNYYGIVQLNNEKTRKLDILAHLDVVPADASEWSKTDPFVIEIEDGKVYGRGTADDKGPALAVIYSLRAIKELGLEVRENPRVFLGCNEEAGSAELPYYFERNQPAEMTITPDASFPVINIEKGILVATVKGQYEIDDHLPRIISMKGGSVYNTVAQACNAVIEGLETGEVEPWIKPLEEMTKANFVCRELEGGKIEIKATGVAAHASTPDIGNNAIAAMLGLLRQLPLAESRGYADIEYISGLFPHGDNHGKYAGLYMEDIESGIITVCPNVIEYTGDKLVLTIDARLPICFTEEKVRPFVEGIEARGMDYNAQCVKPHYVDEKSWFVRNLLRSYEEFSGEKGYCISTGGLTYCHNIENAVAFGFADEKIDNFMHGRDEFAEIDSLLMGGKIYTTAILRLCNGCSVGR